MTDCARPTSRPGAFSPDGILNINKPRGMTSFDVVARVRRLTGVSRAGHAGTLDPDATGVLLVCLGKATRLAGFLSGETKTYRATVHLGVATDTYDASGRVTASCDASSISLASVREALARFRGRIMQAPPVYSALKVGGRRLYQLARSGVQVKPAPRPVDVFRVELTRWAPPELDLEIDCGKGTYIRSIANDLGSALGCGAHLCALERTRSGPFSVADSVTLGELEEACRGGYWERFLQPADAALTAWPAAVLAEDEARLVKAGVSVDLPPVPEDTRSAGRLCRAYGPDGELIALLERDEATESWHPRTVFSAPGVERKDGLDRACCGCAAGACCGSSGRDVNGERT